ncbi:hypothetical protein PBI_SPORTO_43 [Arthrobacter phage Sporto]|nr:hypothetical protein PBI_SPORTO_43 [Arthrobacter phage Sporto]
MEVMCEDCGVYQDLEDLFVTPRSRLICRARLDCQTRMRLKSKQIIEQVTRSNMSQETTPVVENDPEVFIKKAKNLVCQSVNDDFPLDVLTTPASPKDFYVTWFCKTLGNWKAMVSTDRLDGQYWEVTYNGAKQESYVDHYIKASNVAVSDMDYHRMVTPMSERNYEFRSIPGVSDSIKVSRDGDVQINGRDRYDMSASGIPKHDGTAISIQMAIHLAFPDIPMRHIPTS